MIDWEATRNRLRASETALEQALAVDHRRLEEILRQRAAQLAARRNRDEPLEALLSVLVFRLKTERYALELNDLAEVLPLAYCAAVPGGPPGLAGLINVRGEICNVLELASLLGLPETAAAPAGYVLLLRGPRQATGLRVDDIERIDLLRLQDMSDACRQPAESAAGYVRAVLPDGLALLGVEAILAHPLLSET